MSELYLDDLADKTHRGLMGQALSGFSAGGLPYGYRSVRGPDGCEREIDPEQAPWVLHIFEQFAAGVSPRAIAVDLNKRGVRSRRGGSWALSAIYGDKRGLGILNNCLYIGQQV